MFDDNELADVAAVDLPPLPGGWTYRMLGDLLQANGLSYGIVQPGSEDVTGIPILRVKNIRRGRVFTDDVLRVSRHIEADYQRTRLKGGEVLLSLVGSVGEVAIAPPSTAGWNIARAVAMIRVVDTIASSWIKLCLESELAQQFMRIWQTTTVQATLNLRDVRQLPIVLPPKRVREAITGVVGALDDKIAVNDRIAAASAVLAESFYDEFSRGIGFGSETFASVASVYGGGTPSTANPSYWDGDIAWTTPSDVTALRAPYLFKTSRTITDSGLANCASQLYPAGSIFMTSRATIGAFAVPQIPAGVNQGFIVVVPPRDELRWWLFHEMQSRVDEMLSLANGSTFLELSRKNFKAMPVRVAPPDVVKQFDAKVAPLHQRAAQAARESAVIAELRDTLLPKLMTGEIRVRDAEKVVEDVT